jgi:hypothetical protein
MPRADSPNDELLRDIEAYYKYGGNKSQAAQSRGLRKSTYSRRLSLAEKQFGIKLGKMADGNIKIRKSTTIPLPKKGHIKRYILTSIQNNTHLHPSFENLVAYSEWLDGLVDSSCQLMIGTYSYQQNAYGPKATKRGKYDAQKASEELWYANEAEPHICDESVQLAPGLMWCGEQNILPTASNPLSAFGDYNDRKSNIIPHSKIAMESIPGLPGSDTKLNYTTGTITQRNYIQKKVGILAERKHNYGALLVEIDSNGYWWARQLNVADNHSIMDVGPEGFGGVTIRKGKVKADNVSAGIYWGDIHAAEMDEAVQDVLWGDQGMLDTLRPGSQFLGDVFSMVTRGHHEIKNFKSRYTKISTGFDKVQDEINYTAEFINSANRPWCSTHIVASNHDRHLDRWLNEADFRADPLNAKYFVKLQYEVLDAIDRGNDRFNILEWALRDSGINRDIKFLRTDESCVVAGVENSLHGDLGLNGARGSTVALTKLGIPLNKGHDHKATIRGNVYSAGSCATKFSYDMGPSSRTISHIVTYRNGTRAMITLYANKWRA